MPWNDTECIGDEIPIQCPICGEWYAADPSQKGEPCSGCEALVAGNPYLEGLIKAGKERG